MPRLPLVLAAALILPLPAVAEEVVVFAAASLKTALDPIAQSFQQATGNRVTISYAGSNALAQQILQGAPADIFISASPEWMDEVEKGGEVAGGTRIDLLGNTLFCFCDKGAKIAPPDVSTDHNAPFAAFPADLIWTRG